MSLRDIIGGQTRGWIRQPKFINLTECKTCGVFALGPCAEPLCCEHDDCLRTGLADFYECQRCKGRYSAKFLAWNRQGPFRVNRG